MIRTLKKLLSSSTVIPVVYFSFLGIGLSLFAEKNFTSFFFLSAVIQIAFIFILVRTRKGILERQAQIDIEKQDSLEKENLVIAQMKKEEQALESYRKKIISYSQLKDLTEKLSQSMNLNDTSVTLSEEVSRFFGSEDIVTILYLFQARTGELGLSASQKGQMRINLKSKKGDIFDEWVVKTLQPLLVEDAQSDFRFDLEKNKPEEARPVRSLISAPLVINDKTLGILRVDSSVENYFSSEELRFLTTIADLGAVAIENAQLFERVEDLAIKDSLTGLYLRRYLLERLGEEISRQLRRKKELSFLMIDLDHFKQYNDQFGHAAGDIVLKTVGQILSENFNEPGNLVCRYGGEEFAVVLPDCSKENAIKLAEDIRNKIKSQEILLRKEVSHVAVSIGVATFPVDAQVKDELIHKADAAMYEAKSKGRDRVCFF